MDYGKNIKTWSQRTTDHSSTNKLSKDMITDYPNCRYEGCDMVDVVSQKPMPKQFTFNIGNVLDGLPYPDNTFDLVHLRLFTLALQCDEWPGVIKELLRVTKPGGLVQIMEADIEVRVATERFVIFPLPFC